MQNESENWLYISHGRAYESKEEFLTPPKVPKPPGFDHWNYSLEKVKGEDG